LRGGKILVQINELLTAPETKALRNLINPVLQKYRLYKSTTFLEEDNVVHEENDDVVERRAYIKHIELVTSKLPSKERVLITERYLNCDCYFDYEFFNEISDPPISEFTYYKLRTRAFAKLAKLLDVDFEGRNKLELNNVL
jgi:ArpU family phage transcriptional regulator